MRISVFLPLALGLLVMLEGAMSFCIILSAALIHELGHYFFIRLCGAKIKRIDIEVLGALIAYADSDTSLNSDIAIAMGGIVFNLSAAVIGTALFTVYYNLYLLIFIAANFALAFINLLPIASLDGGRAANAILIKKYDIIKAERIAHGFSFVAKMILFTFSASLIFLSGFNTALIILFLLNFIHISN